MVYFLHVRAPSVGLGLGGVGGGAGRVRSAVTRLSAAVRRRLTLSMHGGGSALVFDGVQVFLLGDGEHRGQDLVVLPVRQT